MNFDKINVEIFDSFNISETIAVENAFDNIKKKYEGTDKNFSHIDSVRVNTKETIQVILDILRKEYDCHVLKESKYLFTTDQFCYFSVIFDRLDHNVHNVRFEVTGDSEETISVVITNIKKLLEGVTERPYDKVTFTWHLFDEGRLCEYDLTTILNDIIFPEAYPFIEDFDKYIHNFLTGEENILVLCGQPGTGKTRLIREIVRRIMPPPDEDDYYGGKNTKITCTNSVEVINCDKFYFNFLSGYSELMVLEDADFNLKTTRKDGNETLNKLLFTADGLIPTKKKIIISTNLNVGNIDSAVIRNGRCYDVLKSRDLTRKETILFLNRYNKHYNKQYNVLEIMGESDVISLCDIYKVINEQQIKDKGK